MVHRIAEEVKETYRDKGLGYVLRRSVPYLYNEFLRPLFPARVVQYNGIAVAADRVTDELNPTQDEGDRPDYESGLCYQLREEVDSGDTVVVIGGGRGVTATLAATLVGEDGTVHVYEGSGNFVPRIRDTARRNGVEDRVIVHKAIVGSSKSVWGAESKLRMHPSELPNCDVLELDCEGAELDILEGLTVRPRSIIVETHGHHGAPTAEVREILESNGYSMTDERIAEVDYEERHRENDVMVLTAIRDA